MKTKKFFILFPSVYALVAMLVFCNSVGFAQDFPIIEPRIKISEGKWICLTLDQNMCPEKILSSNDACNNTTEYKETIPIAKLYGDYFKGRQVKKILPLPCNSFLADVEGNTVYYCSGGLCYP